MRKGEKIDVDAATGDVKCTAYNGDVSAAG